MNRIFDKYSHVGIRKLHSLLLTHASRYNARKDVTIAEHSKTMPVEILYYEKLHLQNAYRNSQGVAITYPHLHRIPINVSSVSIGALVRPPSLETVVLRKHLSTTRLRLSNAEVSNADYFLSKPTVDLQEILSTSQSSIEWMKNLCHPFDVPKYFATKDEFKLVNDWYRSGRLKNRKTSCLSLDWNLLVAVEQGKKLQKMSCLDLYPKETSHFCRFMNWKQQKNKYSDSQLAAAKNVVQSISTHLVKKQNLKKTVVAHNAGKNVTLMRNKKIEPEEIICISPFKSLEKSIQVMPNASLCVYECQNQSTPSMIFPHEIKVENIRRKYPGIRWLNVCCNCSKARSHPSHSKTNFGINCKQERVALDPLWLMINFPKTKTEKRKATSAGITQPHGKKLGRSANKTLSKQRQALDPRKKTENSGNPNIKKIGQKQPHGDEETTRALSTLEPGEWLNDNVIIGYLRLTLSTFPPSERKGIVLPNTHWFLTDKERRKPYLVSLLKKQGLHIQQVKQMPIIINLRDQHWYFAFLEQNLTEYGA